MALRFADATRWLGPLLVLVVVATGCEALTDDDRPGTAVPGASVAGETIPPPADDADGDSVPDSDDRCPRDREDGRWSQGTDGCPDTFDDLMTLATADIGGFWEQAFAEQGIEYLPPAGVVAYTAPVATECGELMPQNASYCGLDHTIYYDAAFLEAELVAKGDFAPVFILAHEWGHLVQANLAFIADGRLAIQLELQADCFAGVYARDADDRGLLEAGDQEEAVSSLLEAGDPANTPWYHPGAHGTSQQRIEAFDLGYTSGMNACFRI